MNKDALQTSYEHLGISPEASMGDVNRAFRELRNLYSTDSLATYSLLDDADRQEKLTRLQASFDLILQARQQATPPVESTQEPVLDFEKPPKPESRVIFVDADPQQMPGLFLQQTRKARGMSLQDLAERTKIGSYKLECIEEQRFNELPAPVYLRGFVKEFCRTVEVPDVDLLVESFMVLYQANK